MLAFSLLLACTFQPGGAFTELRSASLDAALIPGEARDLGGGAVLTDLGYAVQIESFSLGLQELDLQELQGGGAEFDPANPPAGYTLCHGGHCHSESGELVDYADVEAELAGDDATFEAVASFPIDEGADLLAGVSYDLPSAEPSPELPLADISRASLSVNDLQISGSVSGGDLAEAAALSIDLAELGEITGGFDLPIDRDQAPVIELELSLSVGGTLFDGLDFAGLAEEGGVILDDLGQEASAALLQSLLDSDLNGEVRASK